jgi:CRISPR-associated protein Csh1
MIEALYDIGKIQEKKDFLEEFIEDISDRYKHVFKIIFNISDENNIFYDGIDYEEFSINKKMKYFYKGIKGNSTNYTPTTKITNLSKTFKVKISKSIKDFISKNKVYLEEKDKHLLVNINKVLLKDKDKILEELKDLTKNQMEILNKDEGIKDGGIITFAFKKKYKIFYIGEMNVFKSTFMKQQKTAEKSYFHKYNIDSLSKNKNCYLCKKVRPEVWGFVDTYKFYTADKKGFVTGGFKQEDAWKNYPVCPDCSLILKRGKKYIEENLRNKFCGFNYFVIPQLIYSNKVLLKQVLKRMKSYTSFSLQENRSTRIESTEERILDELSKESNNVNFNFIFYKTSNSAFNILLQMQGIAPTRLSYLIKNKDTVDNQERKYNIFNEIKLKNGDILNYDFSFRFIRSFFMNSKVEGNYDKAFLAIVNNIFIKKNIDFEYLLQRIMEKIRADFLNDRMYSINTLKAYKIILYIEKIGQLKRRSYNMDSKYNDYKDFFDENLIFDNDTKKALFLEGVLAEKLLNIQYSERNSTPFRSRLNGLKINEKVAKRLLSEIINKLEEYDKNYYKKLEKAIGFYMLNSDFTKYSVDEISFYFTLGMVLSKEIDINKQKDQNKI